jgi:hypothetical protein
VPALRARISSEAGVVGAAAETPACVEIARFADRGFDGTSVGEIERTAGLARFRFAALGRAYAK